MRILNSVKFWFCETFGKRDVYARYYGYGNFEEFRGWWLFGHWVELDIIPEDACNKTKTDV